MSLLQDRRLLLALGAAAVAATVLTVYYMVGASAAAATGEEEEEEEEEDADAAASSARTSAASAAAAARASPARAGASSAGAASVSSKSEGGLVSAAAFALMLRELADKLEAFQEEMAPKAEAHMGSEAGFEAYQRAVTEGIQGINEAVERAHGMDRAAAARAQEAHAGDAEVAAQMARVKRVIFGDEEAGDSVDVDAIEVPPGMTPDTFFALFCKHVATVERAYAEVIEEARRSVKDRTQDPEALATYLKLLLQRKMPEILARAQAAVGLDEEVFRSCLMKFQGVRARDEGRGCQREDNGRTQQPPQPPPPIRLPSSFFANPVRRRTRASSSAFTSRRSGSRRCSAPSIATRRRQEEARLATGEKARGRRGGVRICGNGRLAMLPRLWR